MRYDSKPWLNAKAIADGPTILNDVKEADVSSFRGVTAAQCSKTLVVEAADGGLVALVLRGRKYRSLMACLSCTTSFRAKRYPVLNMPWH